MYLLYLAVLVARLCGCTGSPVTGALYFDTVHKILVGWIATKCLSISLLFISKPVSNLLALRLLFLGAQELNLAKTHKIIPVVGQSAGAC